ncbi:hypothetical protein E2C01_056373 [Portunus trituberculatus]|uniref:Uncharacterized protein n=1 Tax=Portunus trituberculatus TaxID=210409 RepID=A0A5B7GQG1_PORTR|nr:hypothetical protein [Portunus trituberculatus]
MRWVRQGGVVWAASQCLPVVPYDYQHTPSSTSQLTPRNTTPSCILHCYPRSGHVSNGQREPLGTRKSRGSGCRERVCLRC